MMYNSKYKDVVHVKKYKRAWVLQGGEDLACDKKFLLSNNIHLIIHLGKDSFQSTITDMHYELRIHYKYFPRVNFANKELQNINSRVIPMFLNNNQSVLICCSDGLSAGPALAINFLINCADLSPERALELIATQNSKILIHPKLWKCCQVIIPKSDDEPIMNNKPRMRTTQSSRLQSLLLGSKMIGQESTYDGTCPIIDALGPEPLTGSMFKKQKSTDCDRNTSIYPLPLSVSNANYSAKPLSVTGTSNYYVDHRKRPNGNHNGNHKYREGNHQSGYHAKSKTVKTSGATGTFRDETYSTESSEFGRGELFKSRRLTTSKDMHRHDRHYRRKPQPNKTKLFNKYSEVALKEHITYLPNCTMWTPSPISLPRKRFDETYSSYSSESLFEIVSTRYVKKRGQRS